MSVAARIAGWWPAGQAKSWLRLYQQLEDNPLYVYSRLTASRKKARQGILSRYKYVWIALLLSLGILVVAVIGSNGLLPVPVYNRLLVCMPIILLLTIQYLSTTFSVVNSLLLLRRNGESTAVGPGLYIDDQIAISRLSDKEIILALLRLHLPRMIIASWAGVAAFAIHMHWEEGFPQGMLSVLTVGSPFMWLNYLMAAVGSTCLVLFVLACSRRGAALAALCAAWFYTLGNLLWLYYGKELHKHVAGYQGLTDWESSLPTIINYVLVLPLFIALLSLSLRPAPGLRWLRRLVYFAGPAGLPLSLAFVAAGAITFYVLSGPLFWKPADYVIDLANHLMVLGTAWIPVNPLTYPGLRPFNWGGIIYPSSEATRLPMMLTAQAAMMVICWRSALQNIHRLRLGEKL